MSVYDNDEKSYNDDEWLDVYIKYAKIHSGFSFDLLQEAYGIWTLSAVAANRASLIFEGTEYYPTTSMLIADTINFRYEGAQNASTELLNKSGIDWKGFKSSPFFVLDDDEISSESFVQLDTGVYDWIDRRPFARSLERYGQEASYLAVVSEITPRNMAEYISLNSSLWNNGFLSQSLIIAPTDQEMARRENTKDRASYDSLSQSAQFLSELIEPLQRMDQYLEQGKQVMVCSYPTWYHFHRYEYYLDRIKLTPDLDKIYVNLVKQHMMTSMFLALIEGSQEISLWHVVRAQKFCERVRVSVENLYHRIMAIQMQMTK